ncbi:MAG: tRNA preQ1(34) S-adenosylmethionine ribosyltransferase-isomerase QueA [Rhodobacteraceae bacterium]|nr:tRNA preQ1(34) S-adenosylmethionine ribosyltransferase-isomerase QueA [Paracoccaceae bacterium]
MTLSDFDFELPENLIALRPASPRPSSKMLFVERDKITDSNVSALGSWLQKGDLLVFNNTKVIPARISGLRKRETIHGSGESKIDATLIERLDDKTWKALARPLKRLQKGDIIWFGGFSAEVILKEDGQVTLEFDKSGEALDALVNTVGQMPLPPYIASKRPADAQDHIDYQTVFAKHIGAVAAPTASLHFDQPLLDELAALGVNSTEVTLHVGAGTFLPVKVENIADHKMHSEWGEVSAEAAQAINDTLAAGHRVIPVGTTASRLIETAATDTGEIGAWSGDTDIFITPGYEFKVTSGLMTNFHLPKSTLLMLVSALMGQDFLKDIYGHAIENKYRFFSYGDSSLLFPPIRDTSTSETDEINDKV